MIKLIIYIAIAVFAFGVYNGIVEIKIHSERLGNISGILQSVTSGQDLLAQGQYYGTTWKRGAELYFAGSTDAKFALDIKYVKKDADNLGKAFDEKASTKIVIAKGTLLSETLDRAKKEMSDVSKDTIAKLRDDTVKAFAQAEKELGRVQGLSDEVKKLQEQLETITKASPGATPATSSIPLKF